MIKVIIGLYNDSHFVEWDENEVTENMTQLEKVKSCLFMAIDTLKDQIKLDDIYYSTDWWKDTMLMDTKKL